MGLLAQLNKATEDYHRRLVDQLRPFVSRHTFEHAHRRARGYAGGRASPKQPTGLVDALNSGVLRQASDKDLLKLYEMVQQLSVVEEQEDDLTD